MAFYKVLWWCPKVDNEFKENENEIKIPNVKKYNVMKTTSKTIFNQLHLTATFNDKFWRSKLDILLLSI